MVIDDYRGFPTASAISNWTDEITTNIFLLCIKGKIGSLKPKCLIMDMTEAYFNSWQQLMGKSWIQVLIYVACTWNLETKFNKDQG